MENAIHVKDTANIVKSPADLSDERRDGFIKRIAEEDKAARKGNKTVAVWYELSGNKLLKKTRKALGSVLSSYVGNIKTDPDARAFWQRCVSQGLDQKPDTTVAKTVEKTAPTRKRVRK